MITERDETSLEAWIDRARRMVDYRDEAADFLRRALSHLPVFESDIGLVCRLWARADELDEVICGALTEFDSALFEFAGELDITRGVETSPVSESDSQLAFLCRWSMIRPERTSVSCVLRCDRQSGVVSLEVCDRNEISRPIPYPIADPSDLYESLSECFFDLSAGSQG